MRIRYYPTSRIEQLSRPNAIVERGIPNSIDVSEFVALSEDERERLSLLGQRLGSEIASALRELPETARGGSGLSRFARVDRATCQRIVHAARQSSGLEVLRKVPGPAGLHQFVRSVREHLSPGALAGIERAAEEYDGLVRELGGSQTRLLARLDEQSSTGIGESDLAARANLFAGSSQIVGRWSEVGMFVSVYGPTPDGDRMDRVNATGFLGHRGHRGAVPLTTGSGRLKPKAGESGSALSLDGSPAEGATPLALLEEFCSKPLPVVTSRQPNSGLFQVLDYEGAESGRSVDIVTARMNAKPIELPSADDPVHAIWMTVSFPARHLLADVYLHRSLARRCIPAVNAHLHDLHHFDPKDWATRFRDQPTLQLLGPGISQAECKVYPSQPEVTRALFDGIGWDPDQFVGYRCEIAYPIWRAGYCVWFDFSSEDD